jgi:RNA-directed DNA polymerase
MGAFDTIPHRALLQSVARRIVDRHVLGLIKMWLKAPVEETERDGTRRMSGGRHSTCGTPQGGVVSPLLANLYMNRFLKYWRQTGRAIGRLPGTVLRGDRGWELARR